jgi:hypothetical protein
MCRRAHDQCRMRGRPRYECGAEYPQRRYTHLLTSHARARASRTGGDTRACTHAVLHPRKSATKATVDPQLSAQQRPSLIRRDFGVQRLEVLVAVMLARERRALADAEDGGCTEFGAALATLPSGLLEMVADAVAALGHSDA